MADFLCDEPLSLGLQVVKLTVVSVRFDVPARFRNQKSTGRRKVKKSTNSVSANNGYAVACKCGRITTVDASAAGTQLICECGEKIAVPRLSELRTLAGVNAYETSSFDAVKRMIASGELPGKVCVVSGRSTDDTLPLTVTVATEFVGVDSEQFRRMATARSPFSLLFWWMNAMHNLIPVDDNKRLVATPISMETQFHASYRAGSQAQLKRLLRKIPAYAKLLDEFAWSQVDVLHPPA